MRLLFAGTPAAAVASLDALLQSHHEVVGVLTRPDAEAGRGRQRVSSDVKVRADECGVPVFTPSSVRDSEFLAVLRDLDVDAAPIVAYGALIPGEALSIPRNGWINLHFSLLPAWRGAAPVQRAIMAGDDITGATTFVLDEGLDTGPTLGLVTEAVHPTDTAGDLLGRLAVSGASLLVRTLDAIEQGVVVPVPQPSDGVSLAPKVLPADLEVQWKNPALAIDRLIRGGTPDPGAWSTFRGDRLGLAPVRLATDIPALKPGEIVATKSQVLVGTGSCPVVLGEVRPAGRRAMVAADWARGARLESGETLGSGEHDG